MGYTHSWQVKQTVDPKDYKAALREVAKVVKASPVLLGGSDGTGEPEIDGHIWINGKKPEDFETFELPAEPTDRSDFCKTGFTYIREYDVVIVACLCALDDCLRPHVEVKSDGNTSDWEEGRALASKALGREVRVPATIKEG